MRNPLRGRRKLRPYGVVIIQGAQSARRSTADTDAMINIDPTPAVWSRLFSGRRFVPKEALPLRPIG